ncbi:MAG: hypothetical protein KKG60_02200 [Nanoarchaeota archaeon]|nr:hypothetical protein [Nanoarchaeota archaeon]
MKTYLNEQGEIVEKPENLIDHLELESPELADKLGKVMQWKANLQTYRFFIYSLPAEDEIKIHPSEREKWSKYLDFIDSQAGIHQAIPTINSLRNNNMEITGDKVLVVRSDRPFFDTLLAKDMPHVGICEGYVGNVISYDITNLQDSNFFSLDGKVYQRFVLDNARKLSNKELTDWAWSKIMYAMHHHNTEGLEQCINQLEKSQLGNKKVTIYDKFPNIDHFVLNHVLKEDELAVQNIPYEEAERIDLLPYYGQRQIKDSQFIVIKHYLNDSQKGSVFVGEDTRSISEIYQSFQEGFSEELKRQFLTNSDIPGAQLWIGKFVRNFLTTKQKEHTSKVSYEYQDRWIKRYIDEKGLKLEDKTVIGANVFYGKHKQEVWGSIMDTLGSVLIPKGYEKTPMCISYGFNDQRRCDGRMRAETWWDFREGIDIYAGELLIKRAEQVI